MSGTISHEEWVGEIERLQQTNVEGAKGITCQELATIVGIGRRTCNRILEIGVREGRYRKLKGRRPDKDNNLVEVPVYQFVEKTENTQ